MANSIDFGTLAIGALIGVGCRKQLKAASRLGANLASCLATSAAVAVNAAAAEIDGGESKNVNGNGGNKNGN